MRDRDDIDALYRCPECVVETVPTDLEAEREAYRRRMRCEKRRRAVRRPYTMLPGPFSEKPERVNRRGEG